MNIFELPKNEDITEVDLGNHHVKLITVTDQNRESIIEAVLMMYTNEPCRICGQMIVRDDVNGLVFAGYSKNYEARTAHNHCWLKNIPQSAWAYPD